MTARFRTLAEWIGIAAVVGGLTVSCATADQRESAQAAGAEGRQCFLPSQVSGFHPIDSNTVHVRVGARDVYELQLFGTCQNVNWSQRIGIRSTGGLSWVCRGMDAELIVPDPIGVNRCLVRTVRKLSDAEAEALRHTH